MPLSSRPHVGTWGMVRSSNLHRDCTAKPMLTKPPIALIAALVLFTASSAFAQSHRQAPDPQRRAVEARSAPVLTNPRNAGQAAQDCSSTYQGYRLCDWLRPSPWP